jgi:peptidyl-tRNA hydrolase, PTH1 family
MKLVVGLGNIGDTYANTRHNVGFIVIDHFLSLQKETLLHKEKLSCTLGVFRQNNESYVIMKPTTFMNLSGKALKSVMNYYQIEKEDVLVFVDDVYLEVGEMRLREQGGHGGQNGLRHIIEEIETEHFKRVRIGIGLDKRIPLDQYVLSKFKTHELEAMEDIKNACAEIISKFIEGVSYKDIMTTFNKKRGSSGS